MANEPREPEKKAPPPPEHQAERAFRQMPTLNEPSSLDALAQSDASSAAVQPRIPNFAESDETVIQEPPRAEEAGATLVDSGSSKGGPSSTVVDRPRDSTRGAPSTARPLPERIGGCRIRSEIARGGMGVVYRAYDEKLGRTVALKAMLGEALAAPTAVERFLREARAAAQLRHPNIVSVYEVGQHEGISYFTMDLVEGRPLSKVIAEDRPSAEKSVRLCAKIARALELAHSKAIVHRDVKPSNILVDARGEPYLTDFGLARIDDPEEARLTKSGAILGTPAYMPPEQALGRRDAVGAWSDTYSLGATLYELLTLRPPFLGASNLQTVKQVLEADPIPPRQLDPRVPQDVETICLKALQKEPAKRYVSALSLAEDLEHFLSGEPIAARPATLLERGVKAARRHPVVSLLTLSIAGLTLAATGALFALDVREREAARATDLRKTASAFWLLERERGRLRKAPLRLVAQDKDLRQIRDSLGGPAETSRANLGIVVDNYVAHVSSVSFFAVVRDIADDAHVGAKIRVMGSYSREAGIAAALERDLPRIVDLGAVLEKHVQLEQTTVRLDDRLYSLVVSEWYSPDDPKEREKWGDVAQLALVLGYALDDAWAAEMARMARLDSEGTASAVLVVQPHEKLAQPRIVASTSKRPPSPEAAERALESVLEARERGAVPGARSPDFDEEVVLEQDIEGTRYATLARPWSQRAAPRTAALYLRAVPGTELRLRAASSVLLPLGSATTLGAFALLLLLVRRRRIETALEREAARRLAKSTGLRSAQS
ncbi:serine/threonine protein kinase [bacterium]|nr:serine/threonine protein kinase [bacterium]